MRFLPVLLSLLLLTFPRIASGQSFVVQGSAGPTLVDSGYGVSAGLGFSPSSRLTFLLDLDRTHLSSRLSSDGRGGFSGFRGGTLTMASAQVRVTPFGVDRVGPYGLAGFAAGVSKPNVNETFPDPVSNDVRGLFFGGGIHVPVKGRLNVFADARMMLGEEAGELLVVAPIRAGLAWRF